MAVVVTRSKFQCTHPARLLPTGRLHFNSEAPPVLMRMASPRSQHSIARPPGGRISGRVIVGALAASAVAWMTLVVLAPDLPPAVAAIVYGIGGVVCHQRPERSFHWHGAQLAVCARCTGIYLGACTTAILAPLPPTWYAGWAGPPARIARLLAVAALPMAMTLAAEWTGVWMPSSIARAVTGVVLGAAVALVVTSALGAASKARRGEAAIH